MVNLMRLLSRRGAGAGWGSTAPAATRSGPAEGGSQGRQACPLWRGVKPQGHATLCKSKQVRRPHIEEGKYRAPFLS